MNFSREGNLRGRVVHRSAIDWRSCPPDAAYPGFKSATGAAPERGDLKEAVANFRKIWRSPYGRGRYGDGSYPVMYTAEKKTTSYKEVGHYALEYYNAPLPPGESVDVDYVIYTVRIFGKVWYYENTKRVRRALCSPSYEVCIEVAKNAIRNGVATLVVPSARDQNGCCAPVLCGNSTSEPLDAQSFKIGIASDNEGIIVRTRDRRRFYAVGGR